MVRESYSLSEKPPMERPLVISNLQCFLVLVRRPTVRWNSCYGGSNTSTGTRLYGSSSPAFPVRLLVHETSTFSKPCDVYAPMRGDEKDETDPAGRPQRTAAKTFFLSFLLVSTSIARLLVPIDRTERNALSMERGSSTTVSVIRPPVLRRKIPSRFVPFEKTKDHGIPEKQSRRKETEN